MTQPSPQDDLPPGPWTPKPKFPGVVVAGDGRQIALACGECPAEQEAIARAIAAIPEMRAQIGSLKDEIDWHCGELDRLRAEKAELIEMLATRTTHPEYVELLRRYRPANETEA
jgi:hypothetical protein